MDAKLFDIIVCPECKGPLQHEKKKSQLICRRCKLIYPINERGVPVLLADEAIHLTAAENKN